MANRVYVHNGSNNPNATLNEEAVREIRDAYARHEVSVDELAKSYGVKPVTIYKVLSGERWASVG